MKEKKGNDVKLYNVLFPFWMLMLFPILWIIILPGNFIIDSLVLLILMKALGTEIKKGFYKKHIIKIFCFGMLSDMIGAGYMLLMMLGFELGRMGDELYLTGPALVISALLIFVFNYFITFKGSDLKTRRIASLTFAIATAPYTFLVPSSWLYG